MPGILFAWFESKLFSNVISSPSPLFKSLSTMLQKIVYLAYNFFWHLSNTDGNKHVIEINQLTVMCTTYGERRVSKQNLMKIFQASR